MKKPIKFPIALFSCLAGLCAFFIGFNLLASQWTDRLRVDLSASHFGTLTKQTHETISALRKSAGRRIDATLYYSPAVTDDPELDNSRRLTNHLLKRFEQASGGLIHVHSQLVTPFSEAETKVEEIGLNQGRDDKGQTIILGIGMEDGLGHVQSLKWLAPQDQANVQDRIRAGLNGFSIEGPCQVAVLTDLNWLKPSERKAPMLALAQLAEAYQLVEVPAGFSNIAPDIDTLLIVEPPELSPISLAAIANFSAGGGKIILALDRQIYSAASLGGRADASDTIAPLLDAWGIGIHANVLADRAHGLPIAATDSGNIIAQPLIFPADIAAPKSTSTIFVASPSAIYANAQKWTLTPLLKTAETVHALAPQLAQTQDPQLLLADWPSDEGSQIIAARLTPKPVNGAQSNLGPITLIGDVDFLNDGLYVGEGGPLAANAQFFAYLFADSAESNFSGANFDHRIAWLSEIKARNDANFYAHMHQYQAIIDRLESHPNLRNDRAQLAQLAQARKNLNSLNDSGQRQLSALKFGLIGLSMIAPLLWIFWALRIYFRRQKFGDGLDHLTNMGGR